MKTSELTGAALDWVVAKCEGQTVRIDASIPSHLILVLPGDEGAIDDFYTGYAPSTDWAQGGLIIVREGFSRIVTNISGGYTVSKKQVGQDDEGEPTIKWVHGVGETLLIAAMRCYVASKLGDDVEIPKELT